MLAEYIENSIEYSTYFNIFHGNNDRKSFVGFLHKKPLAGIEHTVLSNSYMMMKLKKKFKYGYIDDMYITLNTFYRQERTIDTLRWLNALYIDIDCYKMNMTKESALYFLETDHFGKDIPEPTMIVDSGRGLYLIFQIKPVPSMARTLWDALQKNFQHKLNYLGADAKALDAARVLRIPGSRNSKSDSEVKIIGYHNNLYDIQELKREYLPEVQFNKKRKQSVKKKNNVIPFFTYNSLYKSRLDDIEKLVEMRMGEMNGCREMTLFLYRYFLSLVMDDPGEIQERMLELNQKFSRPLPEREAISSTNSCILKAKLRKYNYRTETIVKMLDITAEEQKQLSVLIQPLEKNERRKEVRKKARRNEIGITEREKKKLEKLMEVKRLIGKGYSIKEIAQEVSSSISQIYRDIKSLEKEEIQEKIVKLNKVKDNPENVEESMGLEVSHEMSSNIDALASVPFFFGEDVVIQERFLLNTS